MSGPTLFDVEPSQGRTRQSDPEPSVIAARRCRAPEQRITIATLFAAGDPWVTADLLYKRYSLNEHGVQVGPDRSAWSSRLGGLVADGILCKRQGTVPGRQGRPVTAYELNGVAGRAWVADLLGRAS